MRKFMAEPRKFGMQTTARVRRAGGITADGPP
jgi:hypothetical protein